MGVSAAFIACLVGITSCSHFRYGTIRYRNLGGNSVAFTIKTGWRRSHWPGSGLDDDGKVKAGDTFEVGAGAKGNQIYFGDEPVITRDGTKLVVNVYSPTSTNTPDYRTDTAMGTSTGGNMDHTYPTATDGANPWIMGFFGCCRLQARPDGDPSVNPDTVTVLPLDDPRMAQGGLNNNGYKDWNIQTSVDMSSGPNGSLKESPQAIGRPVIRVRAERPFNDPEIFDVIAVDREDDEMEWSLGSATEMGDPGTMYEGHAAAVDNIQPGYGNNLNRDGTAPLQAGNRLDVLTQMGISMEGNIFYYGEASWATIGVQTGYWQTTIMVSETSYNSKIPIDFLMLVLDAAGNEPPMWEDSLYMGGPTPLTEEDLVVNCGNGRFVQFTMRASDPQIDGHPAQGAGQAVDHVNIFTIDQLPPNVAISAQSASANQHCTPAQNAVGEFNPSEIIVKFTPSCSQLGKTVVCFQAEDFHQPQPLDSRVRCVIIVVNQIVNVPPVFCGATPADGTVMSVCRGQAYSFPVEVCDANSADSVHIDFIGNFPAGFTSSDIGYNNGINGCAAQGDNNCGKKTMSISSEALTDMDICFQGREGVVVVGEGSREVLKTERRCVKLSVSYEPEFETPMVETVYSKVCEEISYTVRGVDKNSIDDVNIFVIEDPGLPNGAVVEANVCPPPIVDPEGGTTHRTCNPVHRVFKWTPAKSQVDKTYKVCYVARDNADQCQLGGYYGQIKCVNHVITKPEPYFVYSNKNLAPRPSMFTPDNMKNVMGYVGCTTQFDIRVKEDAGYCVNIWDSKTNPLPAGATFAPMTNPAAVAVGEGAAPNTCNDGNRHFAWKPVRGQEAFSYKVCFYGSDHTCDKVLHDGHNQLGLPAMSVIGETCVNIHIERCKYCIQEGNTLSYLARYYHLDTNWLRLWNFNGNADRLVGGAGSDVKGAGGNNLDTFDADRTVTVHDPDEILVPENVIHVGNVYKVQVADTLVNLASRFHTTVKKILSLNPDINHLPTHQRDNIDAGLISSVPGHMGQGSSVAGDIPPPPPLLEVKADGSVVGQLNPGQELCMMPCTDSGASQSDSGSYYAYNGDVANDLDHVGQARQAAMQAKLQRKTAMEAGRLFHVEVAVPAINFEQSSFVANLAAGMGRPASSIKVISSDPHNGGMSLDLDIMDVNAGDGQTGVLEMVKGMAGGSRTVTGFPVSSYKGFERNGQAVSTADDVTRAYARK